MLTKGGHKATAGTYWNVMNGERLDLAMDGVLPGDDASLYLKAPGAIVLAAGPVLGLIFAVFLPFIAIAMTLFLAVGKAVEVASDAAAGMMTFGWRPIESYLAGKKTRKSAREKKSEGDEAK